MLFVGIVSLGYLSIGCWFRDFVLSADVVRGLFWSCLGMSVAVSGVTVLSVALCLLGVVCVLVMRGHVCWCGASG